MLQELRRLTASAENRRTETGIPRVAMVKGEVPEHQLASVYEPMINLILQGGKTLTIGDQAHYFDQASYFVMTVNLPALGKVHQAGPGRPYIGISLTLDPAIVSNLLLELPHRSYDDARPSGYSICTVTPELLDAWVRILRLMHQPDDIAALAPAYEREILYHVLKGPHGWLLRDIAVADSDLSRVRRAVAWIREHYAEPIEVQSLADIATMSPSAFHRHFKIITSMSPIQFQKRIRLLQARQLLLNGRDSATAVAYQIGYESISHFSRDYSRLFAVPPATDAVRLRGELRRLVSATG